MSRNLSEAIISPGELCLSSSIDFFNPPPVQYAIHDSFQSILNPITPLAASTNTINFQFDPCEFYVDASKIGVCLKLKISMPDDKVLPATEVVTTINYPIGTCFKEMDMKINNVSITSTYGTYGYLSYIQTLLNYGKDHRDSKGQLGGWYDEADKAENDYTLEGGFKERGLLTAESHVLPLLGFLHHPLANQDRLLPPMCQMSWSFTKAEAPFFLKGAKNTAYKYTIEDMQLHITKVKMTASYQTEFEREFKLAPMLYPIRQTYVKDLTITANLRKFSFENIFQNNFLPSYCVVGLTTQTDNVGSMESDPMNFRHCHLKNISFQVDGMKYPSIDFDMDFDTPSQRDWTKGYASLFQNDMRNDNGVQISLSSFAKGYALYGFTFGAPMNCGDSVAPKRLGTPRLNFEFSQANTVPLKVILYAEFDEVFGLDSLRNTIRNYQL